MSDPRELELKLEVAPEKAAALRARNLRRFGGHGVRERLASVYFDTPKHALRKKGLSLRIRSAGEKRIQTIKDAGLARAGLFDRPEWESEVGGEVPDLAAAAGTPLEAALSGRRASGLKPVFATEVERTTWTVEADGSEIEVALDEGRIAADGSARMIAELELELKRGSSSALFALARALDAGGALKIGVQTKSERGYRLSAGEAPSSYKAEPLSLRRGMPAGDAVAAIARACIRHFRLNEAILLETRSVESLHQARVAMRRLRSSLSLFRQLVADPETEALKRRLRALSARLGEARNLDVILERASDLGSGQDEAAADLTGVANRMRADREVAYDRVVETLGSKRFRGLMLDVLAWAEDGAWRRTNDAEARARLDQPIEVLAGELLRRGRKRVRKRGRHLGEISPDARHEVRIEAKKLRYASEFFAGLVETKEERRRHKAFLSALHELQGSLGELNDMETGREIVATLTREAGSAVAPPQLGRKAEARREAALLKTAVTAHRAVADAKPFWSKFSAR